MILAHMMAVDENALICDLAETYHILDYQSLPVNLVAIFSCGLRDTARIRQKLANIQINTEELILAGILDRLSWIAWGMTENGRKGIGVPRSVVSILTGTDESRDLEVFDTPEDYEQRYRLLKGGRHGE